MAGTSPGHDENKEVHLELKFVPMLSGNPCTERFEDDHGNEVGAIHLDFTTAQAGLRGFYYS
jgi:hypothetical protein